MRNRVRNWLRKKVETFLAASVSFPLSCSVMPKAMNGEWATRMLDFELLALVVMNSDSRLKLPEFKPRSRYVTLNELINHFASQFLHL